MSTNFWFFLILSLVLIDFIFDQVLGYVNTKNWSDTIPDEMKDIYDQEKYSEAKAYKGMNGRLGLISSSISLIIILSVLIFGVFGMLDNYVQLRFDNAFLQAGFFFLIIGFFSAVIGMPFGIYKTFVVEEKFGFNKTTIKTYILDKLKGFILALFIGGGLLWVVIYILEFFQDNYWYWLWSVIGFFMLLMNMLYADLFLPLFNKLKPLEKGDLKDDISEYAKKVGYPIKHIYVIDGSKRSTKANAFFSGMGPKKTIALYDTLLEKCSTEEIVAILAHEIGHFKKKHITWSLIISLLQLGLTLFLLEYFLSIPEVSYALGADRITFHVGVIAFGIIFSPVSMLTGIMMNILSRKNEFEADAFAKDTYNSVSLISGLKKLSVDSLSNLTPHPAFVFVHYSHPPLLERIKALKKSQ